MTEKPVRPKNLALVEEEVEVIDLRTPKMECASTIDFDRCSKLDRRLTILPMFPMKSGDVCDPQYLLLANIPCKSLKVNDFFPPIYSIDLVDKLTESERRHRSSSSSLQPTLKVMDLNPSIPSFLREKYQQFFGDLLQRLKVNLTILDYNYTRLNQYMNMLIEQQTVIFKLRPHEIQYIDEHEYPLALEFYLQFDINLFYMKTCSFRFARPRSFNEGLFCAQTPEARYELATCGNCALCYPQYDMTYRVQKYIVKFSQTYEHTFVSGYRTILNCSAICHTKNIIYALTCPCGKVDYIGATRLTLPDRLKSILVVVICE